MGQCTVGGAVPLLCQLNLSFFPMGALFKIFFLPLLRLKTILTGCVLVWLTKSIKHSCSSSSSGSGSIKVSFHERLQGLLPSHSEINKIFSMPCGCQTVHADARQIIYPTDLFGYHADISNVGHCVFLPYLHFSILRDEKGKRQKWQMNERAHLVCKCHNITTGKS